MINKLISWGLRVFLVLLYGGAHAGTCSRLVDISGMSNVGILNMPFSTDGCETYEYLPWQIDGTKRFYNVLTCAKCKQGYWKEEMVISTGGECSRLYYFECVCDTSRCVDRAWQEVAPGVEIQLNRVPTIL